MIRWTGLAPWEFEFLFRGSLTSTFLAGNKVYHMAHLGDGSPTCRCARERESACESETERGRERESDTEKDREELEEPAPEIWR